MVHSNYLKFFCIILLIVPIFNCSTEEDNSPVITNVQKENAVALQIEALCQNFPIVLGISLALGLPEVAVYGVIYYLTSMVIVVSYSFIEKF